jgi:hypothetical protein
MTDHTRSAAHRMYDGSTSDRPKPWLEEGRFDLDMDTTAVRKLPPPPKFQDYGTSRYGAPVPQVHAGKGVRSHRRPRQPMMLAVIVLVLGIVMSGAATIVWAVYLQQDSGVTACKAMAENAAEPKPTHTAVVTEQQVAAEHRDQLGRQLVELKSLRGLFADSRHNDLHNAGVALVDLTVQLIQADDGTTLLMAGRYAEEYAALAGACSAHGAPLPPLSSK